MSTPGAPSKASGVDFAYSQVPGDFPGTLPASQFDLAIFAWQHFVALNWPSSSAPGATRGTPSIDATFIAPVHLNEQSRQPEKPVWMGYYNRNEMLPPNTSRQPPLDHKNTPTFNYNNVTSCDNGLQVTKCGNDPKGNQTYCFQTDQVVLDEASQLGLDYVFAQPSGAAQQLQILYLAKVNQASYDYVVDKNLYRKEDSDKARSTNTGDLTRYGAICQQTSPVDCDASYCLPCGSREPYSEGTVHVKTAWRQLTQAEISAGHHFTADVIAFKDGDGDTVTCTTGKTWGLVGMHIIHKTMNFPTYFFATWEHVDNLASNLTYRNTTLGGPKAGESQQYTRVSHGGEILHRADVGIVNDIVHEEIRGANPNLVWQYYQLVGVQGTPVNYPPESFALPDYYLANNVIESNMFFQNFVGTSPSYTSPDNEDKTKSYGPDGTTLGNNVVFNKKPYNVGGCQGCHGNAQRTGSDMSFLVPGFADAADAMGVFEYVSHSSSVAKAFRETLSDR